jgi:hypothetical protein
MPWAPELFSSPALERIVEERERERVVVVSFFDGLVSGELDALVGSFSGEPELHHPARGRIKGTAAFLRYVAGMQPWMVERNVSVEEVNILLTDARGVEEVVLHLDGPQGRVALPLAVVADHAGDRIAELRIYFSGWPLGGGHALRPPLLQPDPALSAPDVVGDYQRALAAGDAEAAVAAFEPDGYFREPAGAPHVHRGTGELRALYERFFSDGGGIPLEHCVLVDDGHICAIEYNVVRWGEAELPPQAGVAVYARGESGKLAAARVYDDVDPPL